MTQYYHTQKVILEKCLGHMDCMRHCPTQAIRIREGKPVISDELCVDCGTCHSVCTSGAVAHVSDSVAQVNNFKYKVVVPSSVLYSQFDSAIHPYVVHLAFKELGFDEIMDLGISCAVLARAYVKFMEQYRGRRPLISSDCPSMVRLVQVKYPDLVELVAPLNCPRELAARELRDSLPKKLGIRPEEIGIVYVAPCPAKIVSIKNPAEKSRSYFDGAISIRDAYAALLPRVKVILEKFDESQVPPDFTFSAGWAALGGITRSVQMENWLAVSGVDHVMKIFDDIENSRLRNIDFIEALPCLMGCIGGSFNVENPYIARTNNIKQRTRYERSIEIDEKDIDRKLEEGHFFLENRILPRPTKYFDTDLETSIKRMKEIEKVCQKLPHINCGCCGAPTCKAFAEDFVRGEAELTDCIFLGEASKRVIRQSEKSESEHLDIL